MKRYLTRLSAFALTFAFTMPLDTRANRRSIIMQAILVQPAVIVTLWVVWSRKAPVWLSVTCTLVAALIEVYHLVQVVRVLSRQPQATTSPHHH